MMYVIKGFSLAMLTAVAAGTGVWAATGSWRGGVLTWMVSALAAIPLVHRIVAHPDSPHEHLWPEN